MEEITIYKYQLEEIIDALRLTININSCGQKKTSFDRTVMLASAYAKNALEGNKDKKVSRG